MCTRVYIRGLEGPRRPARPGGGPPRAHYGAIERIKIEILKRHRSRCGGPTCGSDRYHRQSYYIHARAKKPLHAKQWAGRRWHGLTTETQAHATYFDVDHKLYFFNYFIFGKNGASTHHQRMHSYMVRHGGTSGTPTRHPRPRPQWVRTARRPPRIPPHAYSLGKARKE